MNYRTKLGTWIVTNIVKNTKQDIRSRSKGVFLLNFFFSNI
jgi:hypothetical protein